MSTTVSVTVYGDFATFTRSDSRLDTVSYLFPTVSAATGILHSIYAKKDEFYYEVKEIRILKPISGQVAIMTNGIKKKGIFKNGTVEPIDANKERTQRITSYLTDVAYTIVAEIHVRDEWLPEVPRAVKEKRIVAQFNHRVKHGKCFQQPYFGKRECMCFFRETNEDDIPYPITLDNLGVMLYSIFDPKGTEPLNTDTKHPSGKTCISYFKPTVINGVVSIPPHDSDEVLKV